MNFAIQTWKTFANEHGMEPIAKFKQAYWGDPWLNTAPVQDLVENLTARSNAYPAGQLVLAVGNIVLGIMSYLPIKGEVTQADLREGWHEKAIGGVPDNYDPDGHVLQIVEMCVDEFGAITEMGVPTGTDMYKEFLQVALETSPEHVTDIMGTLQPYRSSIIYFPLQ